MTPKDNWPRLDPGLAMELVGQAEDGGQLFQYVWHASYQVTISYVFCTPALKCGLNGKGLLTGAHPLERSNMHEKLAVIGTFCQGILLKVECLKFIQHGLNFSWSDLLCAP